MGASRQLLCFHAIFLSLDAYTALKFCRHVSPLLAKDRHALWLRQGFIQLSHSCAGCLCDWLFVSTVSAGDTSQECPLIPTSSLTLALISLTFSERHQHQDTFISAMYHWNCLMRSALVLTQYKIIKSVQGIHSQAFSGMLLWLGWADLHLLHVHAVKCRFTTGILAKTQLRHTM